MESEPLYQRILMDYFARRHSIAYFNELQQNQRQTSSLCRQIWWEQPPRARTCRQLVHLILKWRDAVCPQRFDERFYTFAYDSHESLQTCYKELSGQWRTWEQLPNVSRAATNRYSFLEQKQLEHFVEGGFTEAWRGKTAAEWYSVGMTADETMDLVNAIWEEKESGVWDEDED